MPLKAHRTIANKLGYDLQKFTKQMQLDSHLRYLFELLEIDIVFDVGANTGQYGTMLRDFVGFEGEIHSFEPIPSVYDQLQVTTTGDSKWFTYNFGLSSCRHKAELHITENSAFSSLHTVNDIGIQRFSKNLHMAEDLAVPLQRLEDVINQLIPHCHCSKHNVFLKMDTQGHDRWVFLGAGEFASRFAGIQSEVSVIGIYQDIPDYIDMLKLYRGSGYELTGAYSVNRHRSGHLVELDCVFARYGSSEVGD